MDATTRAAFAADRLANGLHHLQVLADLRALHGLLDPVAVPWLVVKGPALAESLYPDPSLRQYSDLDVLVPTECFGRVLALLETSGVELLDANWQLLAEVRAGELHLRLPHGSLLDLHWGLAFHQELRDCFRVQPADCFERSCEAVLGGVAVRTTDPADTLIHLCLHAAAGGGQLLLWLKDLELLVGAGIDWDAVVVRSRRWRTGPVVGLMLARTMRVLGAQVPREVLISLLPSVSWRGLLAVVDRLSPAGRSTSGGSLGALVARAARADIPESRRRVAHQVGARLLSPAAGPGANGGRLVDRHGGPQDRETFLAAVTAAGPASFGMTGTHR